MNNLLTNVLQKNRPNFHKVVDFNPATDKLFPFNFTASNTELTIADIADTSIFSKYINYKLSHSHSKYGIGGYGEDRVLYKRSDLFNAEFVKNVAPAQQLLPAEARSIHLGIDIWGPAGTKVFIPLGGTVHSFAFNDNFGDYGATIILQHQLETITFYTLYGHLSKADLANLQEGKFLNRGELLAHFGEPMDNGNWPPHLHFQIIDDIRIKRGDYPGVCTKKESNFYLNNCPDPDLILNMLQYVQ